MSALKPAIPATDANIITTDVTTNNASTTKHGFCPKLDNTATNFLTGTGAWAVPAGNGSVTGFTASQNTNSPNNTVNASRLLVSAASMNADFVLQPKGEGAILAQLPNSTATGGNKRGYRAVDLQLKRDSADDVASGTGGFIGGGKSNRASSTDTVVCGGAYNTASYTSANVGGGFSNTSSGNGSCVAGGVINVANAYRSSVLGGYQNTANGQFSSIPGGKQATTRSIYGSAAIASGYFGTQGDAQRGQYILRGLTTDATPKVLTSDQGAADTTNQVVLPNNSSYTVRGLVNSHRTDVIGTSSGWKFEGTIRRGANAASTTIVGGTITVTAIGQDAAAMTWALAVTADTTNGCLKVQFTGEASKTIRTVAVVEVCEVTS